MLVRCAAAAALAVCCSSGCSDDDASRAADGGEHAASDAAVAAFDAGAAAELPDDVDAVLASRCRRCHSDPPKNFAPFPLVTWQNTHAPAPAHEGMLVYEVIAERIHDPGFPMPPAGNPITDADRDVLDAWIEAGAPPKAER